MQYYGCAGYYETYFRITLSFRNSSDDFTQWCRRPKSLLYDNYSEMWQYCISKNNNWIHDIIVFFFGSVATNHRASFSFRIWPQMSDLWIRRYCWILEVNLSYQSCIPCFFMYAPDIKYYIDANQARRKVIYEYRHRVFWSKFFGRDSLDRGGIVRVANKSMDNSTLNLSALTVHCVHGCYLCSCVLALIIQTLSR